ncbi:MAG: DUF488 family protein [Halieaceae bacterium]|nr:DUF488 family protein [Halieaceae bacterium]
MKGVAPSTELRRWFGHDRKKCPEFCRRYAVELESKTDAIQFPREQGRSGTLTLIFAARDIEHNNAVALKNFLESKLTERCRE